MNKDPQIIGGKYYCGYWRQAYEVLAIKESKTWGKSWTVKWDDGRITTHSTPWNPKKDHVIENKDK